MNDVATIAKAVRQAIATARKAGTIQLPADAKVSVRSDNTGLNATVHVAITAPDGWATTTRPGLYGTTDVIPSNEAKNAAKEIADIIRTCRGDHGYVWGSITCDCMNLGSVPSAGWAPGRD